MITPWTYIYIFVKKSVPCAAHDNPTCSESRPRPERLPRVPLCHEIPLKVICLWMEGNIQLDSRNIM